MSELDDFFVHRVAVGTYKGSNASGPVYLVPPLVIDCFLERKRRLVRAPDGQQVVSESMVYTAVTQAQVIKPKSQVTLVAAKDATGNWVAITGETPTTVITTAVNASGPLGLPDHVAAALQ